MDLPGGCRAGCDQGGVDLVVLCQLQVKPGIGPHLRGLEHDDHDPVAAQLRHHGLFVAAACLDADPHGAVLPQPFRPLPVAIRGIVDLQPFAATVERHIEFAFAGIDAGADYARLAHLPRTLPCDANLVFLQPYGPDEEPIAILLRKAALVAAMGYDPTIGGPARAGTPGGPLPSRRCPYTACRSYKDAVCSFGNHPCWRG